MSGLGATAERAADFAMRRMGGAGAV